MDRRRWMAMGLGLGWRAARAGQEGSSRQQEPAGEPPEAIAVVAEHPRLLLTRQRLRLLRRERERRSGRWLQFEALMRGGVAMPERGLANALYYQVAGDEAAGKRAVAWAMGAGADARQSALVFDWCQELLSKQQSAELAKRLERSITQGAGDGSIAGTRSRALAAVALYDHAGVAARELERIVREWWEKRMIPALRAGRDVVSREDAYPLYEMLHAVRDAANVDLREGYPLFFKEYPIEHLLSHYPASYPAAENEFRIGAARKTGEPDLRESALSRAAEMAMVAYDVNAPSSQVLQGWLMHDLYVLRGPFGVPYEFLWANPYQPGLSYYHVPLIYHNPDFGKLFIRSNWDDSAVWFGYFGGVAQLFHEGRVTLLNPKLNTAPLELVEAQVFFAGGVRKFRARLGEEEEAVFVVGLKPRQMHLVEVDQEEAFEAASDPGGILRLDLPRGREAGFRLREIDVPVQAGDRSKDPLERLQPPRVRPRPEPK